MADIDWEKELATCYHLLRDSGEGDLAEYAAVGVLTAAQEGGCRHLHTPDGVWDVEHTRLTEVPELARQLHAAIHEAD